jgi:hypothetical protein
MREDDPEKLAELAADLLPGLRIRRYRHTEPCGPHRDPGPRDDWGIRWHWCWQVDYAGTSWTGRPREASTYLEALLQGSSHAG